MSLLKKHLIIFFILLCLIYVGHVRNVFAAPGTSANVDLITITVYYTAAASTPIAVFGSGVINAYSAN